jgi:hypothetical protein
MMEALSIRRGLLVLFLLAESYAMVHAQDLQLPSTGFISGRAATEKDVEDGNAVFVAKVEDKIIGTPIAITVPQYAFWSRADGKILVVIVQAEEANGMRLFGFRDAAGEETVATGPEIELLGTTRP